MASTTYEHFVDTNKMYAIPTMTFYCIRCIGIAKCLCHVRSTEKNFTIFFNRAELTKGLVLKNVKCVTSLVIHHILHIQLFSIFHSDLIRLVSDSR